MTVRLKEVVITLGDPNLFKAFAVFNNGLTKELVKCLQLETAIAHCRAFEDVTEYTPFYFVESLDL
jgi:hypothetical protein